MDPDRVDGPLCRWVRRDRYPSPPVEDSEDLFLDWVMTTDIEGRFDGLYVSSPSDPLLIERLSLFPDTLEWGGLC